MKKLKYRCPFRGYDNYVAIALFIAVLITISANKKLNGVPEGGSDIFIYILIFIAVAVVVSLAFLIINHETADDKLLRENAKPLEWTETEGWEKEEILASSRPKYVAYSIVILMQIILLIITGRTAWPLLVGVIVIAAAMFFYDMLRYLAWKGMDSTAIKTTVPIFRTYKIRHHTKYSYYYKHYHEIYTTEGKIVLPHVDRDAPLLKVAPDSKISDISGMYTEIVIIRYKNMITYIDV